MSDGQAAIAVVATALPDSVKPSLITAASAEAASRRRLRRTAPFTAAAFTVTLAGGVVVALGLKDLILAALPTLSQRWGLHKAFEGAGQGRKEDRKGG